MNSDERTYWLYSAGDRIPGFGQLFPDSHGITWPGESPLLVLLRGSEGSGKSTLALQLACLGETQKVIRRKGETHEEEPGYPRCILYYVIDDFPQRIKEKFDAFGIGGSTRQFTVKVWGNGPLKAKEKGPCFRADDLISVSSYKDTAYLLLIDCRGPKRFLDVREMIFADVTMARSIFRECAVVIDAVSALELPVEEGQQAAGKAKRSRIEYFLSDYPQPKPSLVVLVDEEGSLVGRDPYLTDVLIRLWQGDPADTCDQGYCERYLQVVKAANCPHVRGPQKFRIRPGLGIEVFPSLIASAHTLDEEVLATYQSLAGPPRNQPVSLGLPGLGDEERIFKGSSSVLVGPKGSFKTPIALLFCGEALKQRDGKAVFFSLHHKPETIERLAEDLGVLDVLGSAKADALRTSMVDADSLGHVNPKHRFIIQYVSLAYVSAEGFLAMVRQMLRRLAYKPGMELRLVIDSISDLKCNYPRLTGAQAFLPGLVNALFVENVTSLFVFDESGYHGGSEEDKVIVNLVDNVFWLQQQSIQGAPRVALDAKVLASRVSRGEHVFHIDYFPAVGEGSRARIEATDATGEYYPTADGHLALADLRLYANRCSDKQEAFNRTICRSFGVPDDANHLDQDLAHGRPESIEQLLSRLKRRKDSSIVVAVDVAYLNERLLENFEPLELQSGETDDDFVNISSGVRYCNGRSLDLCRSGESLRVLPAFVDCSLVLCNLDILDAVARGADVFRRLKRSVGGPGGAAKLRAVDLPVVDWGDLRNAAAVFQARSAAKSRADCHFFGFRRGPNPEPIVCMLFEFLLANRIILPESGRLFSSERESRKDLDRWKAALGDFARFYLPFDARREGPNGAGARTAENCLFFYTWHSLAVADGVPARCVPIKLGKRWRSTRGGWCWGVVDNGLVSRGKEIVRYATGEVMNGFLIDHHAGVPPRRRLCRDTGVLSVYNLGLMQRIIEDDAWSRAHIAAYPRLSSYAYLFFHEFVSFVEGLQTASKGRLKVLERWLDCSLPRILAEAPTAAQ